MFVPSAEVVNVVSGKLQKKNVKRTEMAGIFA